jgi:hypothetical protein
MSLIYDTDDNKLVAFAYGQCIGKLSGGGTDCDMRQYTIVISGMSNSIMNGTWTVTAVVNPGFPSLNSWDYDDAAVGIDLGYISGTNWSLGLRDKAASESGSRRPSPAVLSMCCPYNGSYPTLGPNSEAWAATGTVTVS